MESQEIQAELIAKHSRAFTRGTRQKRVLSHTMTLEKYLPQEALSEAGDNG